MTLIIGCVTDDFGIIAGDTQLTTTGLEREGRVHKSIELKVRKYSNDFMLGILGQWGYFHTTTEANGLATYYNDYDLLRRGISNIKVSDKLEFLNKFLKGREIIKASTIYVKRNTDDFELNSVSNNEEIEDLKTINNDDYKMVFNEPFFSIDDSLCKE